LIAAHFCDYARMKIWSVHNRKMKGKAAWHQRVKVNGTDDSKVADDCPSDNAKLGQQVAEGCYLLDCHMFQTESISLYGRANFAVLPYSLIFCQSFLPLTLREVVHSPQVISRPAGYCDGEYGERHVPRLWWTPYPNSQWWLYRDHNIL
jgi:hypothetical protein